MSLPLATTTVTVLRLPADVMRDGYDDPPDRTSVVTGLRAQIGSPSGRESVTAGDRTVATFTLHTDPFEFTASDRIVDEGTGETYDLVWAQRRDGMLAHTVGALVQATGAG